MTAVGMANPKAQGQAITTIDVNICKDVSSCVP